MARPPKSICFATCAPGLEAVLHDEVRALKLARHERQVGGVRFEGSRADIWRANLELRTAIRILQRVVRFQAPDADALYAGVQEIDWSEWLPAGGSLWIVAQTQSSQLTHSRFIAQRTKDAIVDQIRSRRGDRPDVDREDPSLQLHVHLFRDRATLSIDTSGASLHKRGWRVAQGRAPLAETLAAGVITLSEWDQRSPFVDPFCGSGTLVIEAAFKALDVAPGLFRPSFAFEKLPDHDASTYRRLREEVARRRRPAGKRRILARDRDPERVKETRRNLESAGLQDWIELEAAPAEDWAPRPGWNAWIVTNPPYGERLGEERELAALFERLLQLFGERCDGYHLALLSANPRLARVFDPLGLRRIDLLNGGLEVTLLTGPIEAPEHHATDPPDR